MMAVKLVIGLLIVFFLVTFAVKNQQDVIVSYYFGYSYGVKLWMAVLASFALGAVLTGLGWAVSSIREKSRNWSLSRKIVKLEKELESLKQKPLPDEPNVYPPLSQTPAPAAPLAVGESTKALPPRS